MNTRQCADAGCPAHVGESQCSHKAVTVLRRVDMDDKAGTPMCRECGDDSFKTGLFAEEPWLAKYHKDNK